MTSGIFKEGTYFGAEDKNGIKIRLGDTLVAETGFEMKVEYDEHLFMFTLNNPDGTQLSASGIRDLDLKKTYDGVVEGVSDVVINGRRLRVGDHFENLNYRFEVSQVEDGRVEIWVHNGGWYGNLEPSGKLTILANNWVKHVDMSEFEFLHNTRTVVVEDDDICL